MKPVTALESDVITAILGRIEALFEPVNYAWPQRQADQAQFQKRDKYLGTVVNWTGKGLLPWSNPGGDDAERKKYSRAINSLEGKGLLFQEGKSIGLTSEGITEARRLCDRVQLEECLPGLDALLGFVGTRHEWKHEYGRGDAGWVSEASMAGLDPIPMEGRKRIPLPESAFWVVNGLRVLGIAGYVQHDYHPNFELPLYRLTKDGRALAIERKRAGKVNLDAWPKLKNRLTQDNGTDAFWDAYWKALKHAETAEPLQPNLITIHIGGLYNPGK